MAELPSRMAGENLGIGKIARALSDSAWGRSSLIETEVYTVKLVVTIDRDEDGVWIVECPSIPGCVSQGATKDDALLNVQDAIKACLEVRSERGMPLTIETRHVEVVA